MLKLIPEDEVKRPFTEYIETSYYLNPNDPNLSDEEKRKIKKRTYEVKVDKSHLSNETLDQFNTMFLEEKWFCNYAVSQDDIYKV